MQEGARGTQRGGGKGAENGGGTAAASCKREQASRRARQTKCGETEQRGRGKRQEGPRQEAAAQKIKVDGTPHKSASERRFAHTCIGLQSQQTDRLRKLDPKWEQSESYRVEWRRMDENDLYAHGDCHLARCAS